MAIDNAAPKDVTRLNTTTSKQLPPELYQHFLSDAAKEMKPSASQFFLSADR